MINDQTYQINWNSSSSAWCEIPETLLRGFLSILQMSFTKRSSASQLQDDVKICENVMWRCEDDWRCELQGRPLSSKWRKVDAGRCCIFARPRWVCISQSRGQRCLVWAPRSKFWGLVPGLCHYIALQFLHIHQLCHTSRDSGNLLLEPDKLRRGIARENVGQLQRWLWGIWSTAIILSKTNPDCKQWRRTGQSLQWFISRLPI